MRPLASALVLRNRVVERARSYRRSGSRAYTERTVGRSQDGRLGAATTFAVPASANSSDFPLTNNTAARKACAFTRIPKRGRVWETPRSPRTLLRRSGLPAHNAAVHPKRTARFDS